MMQYRSLGSTGVQVSRLCMGTMTFGKEADASASAAIYGRCRDAGINFFDCANIYVGGESERILGKLMEGHRDELVITSKVYFPAGPDRNARGSSRRHIMLAIEDSLRRLHTDRVDVYFLHRWDDAVPIEESLRALDDLVAQGKVVYLGASNFAAWQVAKALGISARNGWAPIRVIEPMYNLIKRQAEVEILPMAQAENLAVIPYNPLGGGLLSGKYSNRAGESMSSGRITESEVYATRYGGESTFKAAQAFTDLAGELGVHPVTLAVAWAAAHPGVTAPILGARNVGQLEPALAALELDMNPGLYARISALTPAPAPDTDRSEEKKD